MNRLYNFMRYSHILFLFTNIEENEYFEELFYIEYQVLYGNMIKQM